MYLAAGPWCFLHNKATKYEEYLTVANTKDLDPPANPEGAAALLILLHCLLRKKIAAITAKKTAPGGVFCMSGPVAHVDEAEDERQQSMFSVPETVIGSTNPRGNFFVGEKFLPNGDIYAGSWHGNLPEGRGKYLWANGCMYEGHWCRGKKTGNGRISWPSGATYEGDFLGGYLHGFGTYTGVDGATYKGAWLVNQKHGYGHKCYKNGDFYDGEWKHGVQEGKGRYVWENGNEYVGHWRGGLMCGKGILRWRSGDIYEGHWIDGLEHGHGVYKWADGSYYVGTWSKGLKDGKGVFYPPRANQNESNWSHESSSSGWDQQDELTDDGRVSWKERSPALSDFETGLSSSCIRSSETTSSKTGDLISQRSFLFDVEKSSSAESIDSTCIPESESGEGSSSEGFDTVMHSVVEREYVQGVLINEFVKENAPLKTCRRREKQNPKEGKRPGEIIFKGHRHYDLMVNLQLGIRYTVGRITPEPKREIVSADFGPKARIWMRFPPEGSASTPPHQSVDFKWKDYCPMVFRHLRELFKIDAADYMLSICGNDALRELSSPGKSGSVFYLSHDDRFMIKTMRKSEVKVLLRMLPNYYNHVRTYENTLITKFFGLHAVKPAGGHKVRFIVMGNMFCSELHIHRRFDLKGSSQGRSTDKVEIEETTTLKDLDLDFVFYLEPSRRQALITQMERDCKFLESERIMDYSLLLGVHLRAPQFPANFSPGHSANMPHSVDATYEMSKFEEDGHNLPRRMALVPGKSQRKSGRVPVPDSHVDQSDLVLPGIGRLGIRLGVNMPARANRRPPRSERDSHPEGELFREDYDVVLYFGIIDILQDYDITKKLEHAYKSLQFDSLSISAVDPKLYSRRFQDFICRIFPVES